MPFALPATLFAALPVTERPLRGLGRGRARTAPLHPPLDVALLAGRDRERAGWDVLADHRAGAGVGALPHLHRRDEHVVAAGAGVVSDGGPVLVHAVVVHEHRGGADVDALADVGVAHVGEVGDLRPRTDGGLLHLDEGADLRAVPQPGIRAQVGERADL